MADIMFGVDTVPHIKPVIKHVAHHAAYVKPVVTQGVSMLTILITNASTALISAGLAWYIRGRGMTGVKIDLDNAKKEIEKLWAVVNAKVAA